MQTFTKSLLFILFFLFLNKSNAQHFIEINIPDAQIIANKITNGDGDVYGKGDWYCSFTAKIEDDVLVINGKICFSEKANDFTTIVGTYQSRIVVAELQKCRHCEVSLETEAGSVSGVNAGARGYQLYNGSGIIKSAKIVTDTFGNDAGNIGGKIKFVPIRINILCLFASKTQLIHNQFITNI